MKTRVTPAAVAETDGRTVRALISAETVDRESELLLAAGAELDNYRRNPVLLWAHHAELPPIGRALEVTAQPGVGVWAVNEFADTPFAQEIAALYRDGFLSAFSVGFRPLELDRKPRRGGQRGATILRWELIEQSAVAVPANPDALVTAAADGNRAADWLLKTYYPADETALLALLGLGDQPTWPEIAAACARFCGARGGLELNDDNRHQTERLLRGLYSQHGRRFPDWRGELSFETVCFHESEPAWFEEREIGVLAQQVRGRALALRNIARKRRRGGEPLPELDPLEEAAGCLAEVLDAKGLGAPSDPASALDTALADLREELNHLAGQRRAAVADALEEIRRAANGGGLYVNP